MALDLFKIQNQPLEYVPCELSRFSLRRPTLHRKSILVPVTARTWPANSSDGISIVDSIAAGLPSFRRQAASTCRAPLRTGNRLLYVNQGSGKGFRDRGSRIAASAIPGGAGNRF